VSNQPIWVVLSTCIDAGSSIRKGCAERTDLKTGINAGFSHFSAILQGTFCMWGIFSSKSSTILQSRSNHEDLLQFQLESIWRWLRACGRQAKSRKMAILRSFWPILEVGRSGRVNFHDGNPFQRNPSSVKSSKMAKTRSDF